LRTSDVYAWHAVGDLLTPKELWDGVLNLPGMQSVAYQGVRGDQFGGRVQVQIEPSNRVEQAIYVAHNDHFAMQKVDRQPKNRDDFVGELPPIEPTSENFPYVDEILGKSWPDAMRRADDVIMRAWEVIQRAERGRSDRR
jgi:hypothetical protein